MASMRRERLVGCVDEIPFGSSDLLDVAVVLLVDETIGLCSRAVSLALPTIPDLDVSTVPPRQRLERGGIDRHEGGRDQLAVLGVWGD
jgi:hypothetical protein